MKSQQKIKYHDMKYARQIGEQKIERMEFLHQYGQSQGRNVVFPNQLGELPPF
jgi:hypothetical protein